MANSELPNWPGAETVYQRVQAINGNRCKAAYHAWVLAGSKNPGWQRPEDMDFVIERMNAGDEEFLKGYMAQYPNLWK